MIYLKGHVWNRIFFDEADSINIPACRHMNSLMTWFISSSVHNLCNPNIRYINGNLSGISKTGFIRNTMTDIYKINIEKNDFVLKNKDELKKWCVSLDIEKKANIY